MNIDYRAELQRLVKAYDDHGGNWPEDDIEALRQAVERARAFLDQPEPEWPTDEGLIQRLLSLAEQAVKEALGFEYEDPEDRYIWRELQNLKQLVKEANGKA